MGEESIKPIVIPQNNEEESVFMAEESIDPILTPQKNESDCGNLSEYSAENLDCLDTELTRHVHHGRESIVSDHTGDSSKSYAAEKKDSAKITRPKVPHYLRASTGSCHDFCKYGRKQEFVEKPWKSVRKKGVKPPPNEMDFVQITVSGKQKKEKVNNEHSSDVRTSADTKSYSPKVKTSLDAKTDSPRRNSLSSNETRLSKDKPSSRKKSPSSGLTGTMKTSLGMSLPSEKVEVQVKEAYSVDDKMSITEKKMDDRVELVSSGKPKKQVKAKPTSSSTNSDSFKGKITASIAYAKKPLAPSVATLSRKISPTKIISSKAKKPGKLKLVSPIKGRKGTHKVETETSKNEVPEKILHVIMCTEKTTLEKNPSTSHEKSQSSTSPDENDADIEYIGNEEKKLSAPIANVQPVKENRKKILRKTNVVVSEDKYKSPMKLKFRSGKVVDVQSDNNTPRRLKFRKARVLNSEAANSSVSNKNKSMEIGKGQLVKENQNKNLLRKGKLVASEDKYRSPIKLNRNVKVAGPLSDNNVPLRLKFRRAKPVGPEDAKGDSSRRIFKKSAVKIGSVGAVLPPERIILKRQNVEGKKDTQGLFNNVIKETASKLAESRKSNVKALVGAFETVISLQERKPST